jgi:imidazole glycerol-phosphate synthase subunit HisH
MISIVNYGLGNVQAFLNVFYRLDIEAKLASTADELHDADRIILPGVGAFDRAIRLLDESGMRQTLEHKVTAEKVPVIGICVGMQMLASCSDEGELPGLGWIPGRVRSFAANSKSQKLPVPHMGWNDVRSSKPSGLMRELEMASRFYFLHSFYFECDDHAHSVATASYGDEFACVVAAGNVFGVQFHPEKSHHWGAQLLKNFAEIENVATKDFAMLANTSGRTS